MNQGQIAEQQAKRYLQQQGLEWIASNVRYPFGELDLVMRQGISWVFVEVKYRSSAGFGGALNAVSAKKQQRLRKAASHYLQLNRIQAPCRFDLVAIEGERLQWLQNIF
ncbi:MAG: YraN family protein [Shewanella sp.]|nr:YraN family protein [Shewanella sp.]MCF1430788.1 YraN family protein [Shewanella sp.]MCF1458567.1 YraN family protein [Shewanella sp.]